MKVMCKLASTVFHDVVIDVGDVTDPALAEERINAALSASGGAEINGEDLDGEYDTEWEGPFFHRNAKATDEKAHFELVNGKLERTAHRGYHR